MAEPLPVGAIVASALMAASIDCDSGEDVDRFLDELAQRGARVVTDRAPEPRSGGAVPTFVGGSDTCDHCGWGKFAHECPAVVEPLTPFRVFGLTTDEIARAIAVADMHDPRWRDGPLDAARAASPAPEPPRCEHGAIREPCIPCSEPTPEQHAARAAAPAGETGCAECGLLGTHLLTCTSRCHAHPVAARGSGTGVMARGIQVQLVITDMITRALRPIYVYLWRVRLLRNTRVLMKKYRA